jgi:hypothetical protein
MKSLLKLILLVGVVLAFSMAASAGPLITPNAQFGFSGSGGTTYALTTYSLVGFPGTQTDLLNAAAILIPGDNGNGTEVINELPCLYLGSSNDFAPTSGGLFPCSGGPTPLTINSGVTFAGGADGYLLDLSFGTLPTVTFGSSGQYSFVASSGIAIASATGGGSEGLTLYYGGTFYDNSGFPVYQSTPASVTFAFTENSPESSPNFSATFADPPQAPPSSVPEPATMALLGSAFVGLSFIRRRRKA